MKLMPKHVFIAVVVIWLLAFAPFFIPALNSLTPQILGIPFVACWEILVIALHIVLLYVARNYVWDTFDREEGEEMK